MSVTLMFGIFLIDFSTFSFDDLSKIINELHDSNNKITIPGFYDNVIKVSDDDRKKMNSAPFNIDEFKSSIGLKKEHGEEGYTTIERQSIRPALDVNGIWGGYTEEGAKTVLPSKAFAKISMRLVPGQNWKRINAKRQFCDCRSFWRSIKRL